MADERVVAVKLEQIEQYHGELKEKQETLSRDESVKVYETLQTGLGVYDAYSRQVAQWFKKNA